jgi:ABC-type branched-subunit amino acid transport system permease subunit
MTQPDRRLAAQEAGRVARASQRLRTAAVYDGIQAGLERLRTDGWLIVQTAAAAAIAWLLAAAVLHHQQAGFAPIGAVIAVEVTRGQQVRHAIELVLGVTLGIGVAVLLGSVISNPPLRIAVVVGVAMTLALLVSGSLVLLSRPVWRRSSWPQPRRRPVGWPVSTWSRR